MLQSPKTAKGRATRERIVVAASELVFTRGVAETSVDQVIARAGASKSQLYHYFEDRSALLRAVVEQNTEEVLASIGPLDSWKAIRGWFDSMVELQQERKGVRWLSDRVAGGPARRDRRGGESGAGLVVWTLARAAA